MGKINYSKLSKQEKLEAKKFVAEKTLKFQQWMLEEECLVAPQLDYTSSHIKAGLDFYPATKEEIKALFPTLKDEV